MARSTDLIDMNFTETRMSLLFPRMSETIHAWRQRKDNTSPDVQLDKKLDVELNILLDVPIVY